MIIIILYNNHFIYNYFTYELLCFWCVPLIKPVVMHLACVLLGLTMPESLVAATINAAASLGKAASYGSIEVGKVADVVVLDAPRYETVLSSHSGAIDSTFSYYFLAYTIALSR